MPQQELTEEQKQVKQITDKWNRAQYFMGAILISPALFSSILLMFIPESPAIGAFILTSIIATGIGVTVWAAHYSRKTLRNLTSEEIAILESAATMDDPDGLFRRETPSGTKYTASHMRKQRQRIMKTPQEELLRASKAIDDGTLLRPTAETPATPKEELLRASIEK